MKQHPPSLALGLVFAFIFACVAGFCTLAEATDPLHVSPANLQGSFSSFNVPDGNGGTVPTGPWLVEQIGTGTWTFNPVTGLNIFSMPVRASFPGLPGQPSVDITLTETGSFQFQIGPNNEVQAMTYNLSAIHAAIPLEGKSSSGIYVGDVDIKATVGNVNCIGNHPNCPPKVDPPPPPPPDTKTDKTGGIPAPPPGWVGLHLGELPPPGQLPPFGATGGYELGLRLKVEGLPGFQTVTGIGSFETTLALFSDFGNSDALYDCCHGWRVSGAATEDGPQTFGMQFQSGVTGNATEIDVAVSHVSGENLFYVALAADNGGLPGTILFQSPALSSGTEFGNCCGVLKVLTGGTPTIIAGQSYFVIVSTDLDSNTVEMWNTNTANSVGNITYSNDGGVTWVSIGQGPLGAFQILGDTGAPKPQRLVRK